MKKQFLLVIAVCALLLCGCENTPLPIPTQPVETAPPVEQVTMSVTADTLASFDEQYPALKEADLRGSTCYEELEAYIASHPNVDVRYTVAIGSTELEPNTANLTLESGDFEFSVLRTNLKYLHDLKSVYFRDTLLLPVTIQELRTQYPNVEFDYSIRFCGGSVEGETVALDLADLSPEEVMAQKEVLTMLPNLRDIYLMNEAGDTLYSLDDAAALQETIPDVQLHYTFDLFGKRISTEDNEVVYQGYKLSNKEGAMDTIRKALSVMYGCDRFVLDNCGFSNEEMAALREEFRGKTKVVWRIWFGSGGCLTDRDMIYFIYGLYDYNTANLIYCEDAEFIDFGHNEYLRQCDFVAGMPNLRAIILSGSMVSDLSPFTNCKKLEFLELAFCGYVTDISPLAECTSLKRLNIAFTKVDDLSALDNLQMDVMVDAASKTDQEDWQHFDSLHPDCLIQHTGDAKDNQPYNYPWRYDREGKPNSFYAILQEKFHYPHPSNTIY